MSRPRLEQPQAEATRRATQVSGHSAPCHADPPLAPDRPSAGHVPKPEPAHAASPLEIRGGKAWT